MGTISNISWTNYNGTNALDAIQFYNTELDNVYDAIKDINSDAEELSEGELKSAGYVHYKGKGKGVGYWLHPALIRPGQTNRAALLVKCAALNDLDKTKCNEFNIIYNTDTLRGKLGKLIYTVDKYDSNKYNRSEHIVRQVSSFIPYIEVRPNGKFSIRFAGSKDGQEKNRTNNISYLKLLSNGPFGITNDLLCHINGRALLPYKKTNYTINSLVTVTDWEVHHVLCLNNKSVLKTDQPSYTLSARHYTKFTHANHMEMLGCVVLSIEAHSVLHDTDSNDCIDYWFKRYNNNECKSLPYHFRSEENYINTLNWLSNNTDSFNINIAPSYLEFIQMHSFPVLPVV